MFYSPIDQICFDSGVFDVAYHYVGLLEIVFNSISSRESNVLTVGFKCSSSIHGLKQSGNLGRTHSCTRKFFDLVRHLLQFLRASPVDGNLGSPLCHQKGSGGSDAGARSCRYEKLRVSIISRPLVVNRIPCRSRSWNELRSLTGNDGDLPLQAQSIESTHVLLNF